jgi:ubiquitin
MGRQSRRKRALRIRTAGPALLIGPVFDERPHYEACVDHLLRQHEAEIREGLKRGLKYGIEVRHDDSCPTLTEQGCCNCDCVVNLIERGNPEDN